VPRSLVCPFVCVARVVGPLMCGPRELGRVVVVVAPKFEQLVAVRLPCWAALVCWYGAHVVQRLVNVGDACALVHEHWHGVVLT
jgi:hypothetical protein